MIFVKHAAAGESTGIARSKLYSSRRGQAIFAIVFLAAWTLQRTTTTTTTDNVSSTTFRRTQNIEQKKTTGLEGVQKFFIQGNASVFDNEPATQDKIDDAGTQNSDSSDHSLSIPTNTVGGSIDDSFRATSSDSLYTSPPPERVGILDHFNFCNATMLGDQSDAMLRMPIDYQCAGPNYDEFGRQLHDFFTRKYNRGVKFDNVPETWGHRSSPIPANQSVLFFGNSHTRQVGLALACQMGSNQVVDVRHYDAHMIDPNMAIRIRYQNGASLYFVTNSYVAYSPQWHELLEKQIEKPLISFDMVVLGMFNAVKGVSNFRTNLEYLGRTLPYEFQLDKHPAGPSPEEIMAAYDGPLLVLSNMSINQVTVYHEFRKRLIARAEQTGRADQNYTDGRRYIKKMHHEGASMSRNVTADSSTGTDKDARRHRCMGSHGGHPDLISWDIAEFLYDTSDGGWRKSDLAQRKKMVEDSRKILGDAEYTATYV